MPKLIAASLLADIVGIWGSYCRGLHREFNGGYGFGRVDRRIEGRRCLVDVNRM